MRRLLLKKKKQFWIINLFTALPVLTWAVVVCLCEGDGSSRSGEDRRVRVGRSPPQVQAGSEA